MTSPASERALRARLGGLTRWAKTSDRTAVTRPGRTAFNARFEREVDPDGTLPPAERALRVDVARRAYYTRGCASYCASMPGSGGPAVLRDKAIAAALIGVVGAVIAAVVGARPIDAQRTISSGATLPCDDHRHHPRRWGVAVTPDGRRAYVANDGSDSVSVIDTGVG